MIWQIVICLLSFLLPPALLFISIVFIEYAFAGLSSSQTFAHAHLKWALTPKMDAYKDWNWHVKQDCQEVQHLCKGTLKQTVLSSVANDYSISWYCTCYLKLHLNSKAKTNLNDCVHCTAERHALYNCDSSAQIVWLAGKTNKQKEYLCTKEGDACGRIAV